MKKLLLSLMALLLPVVLMAQATPQLMEKANAGDAASMVRLARCYENGAGVAVDSSRALQLYRRVLDLGNAEAAIRLSSYYLIGSQVPVDTLRCYQLRKEWADKGNPDALASLALCYVYGYGVAADTSQFRTLLQRAAKKGSAKAYDIMGWAYCGNYGEKVDLKKAEKMYLKSYQLGFDDAAAALTVFYIQYGDYAAALRYANEALPWGDPIVAVQLADMYSNGWGVPVDEARAQKMIVDVADKFPKHNLACYWAGRLFLFVDDEALRDEQRALNYWKQGDAYNLFLCQHILALYYKNQGDVAQAAYYFDRALANGDGNYKNFCGEDCLEYAEIEYAQGNEAKTRQLLERGMTQYGNAECAVLLASMEAVSDNSDVEKVTMCYRKADQLGDTTALLQLGRFFISIGHLKEAHALSREMIDNGNPDGYLLLAAIYSSENKDDLIVNTLEKGGKAGCRDCYEIVGQLYDDAGFFAPDYRKAAAYYAKSGSAAGLYKQGVFYLYGRIGKQSKKDIAKGFDLVCHAADQGYVDAIYLLGNLYETGDFVDSIDHVKALGYYRLLAENDVPEGLFKMGLYYELGDGGLPCDSVKCVAYYRRAADLGNHEAWCYLGDFYRIGQFVPMDQERAFSCYLMADSLGSATGCYYLGRSFLEGCGVEVDSVAAIHYLHVAAANQIAPAAYLLAEFYNYGKAGLPANSDSAVYYYLQADENGSGKASYYIASQCLKEDNYEGAYHFAVRAANRGDEDGMFLVAVMMQKGLGCNEDQVAAYQIFERMSYSYNDSRVYLQLALARLRGMGCDEDNMLGKAYLDTAAWMGNALAPYYEGLCYLYGYGCDVDTTIALYWMYRGDALGSDDAASVLGDMFYEQKQFDSAFYYYQRAVMFGSIEACCDLGYCYQKGEGVVLNSQKAYELYLRAAESGSARACLLLANCYAEGIYVEVDESQALQWYVNAAEMGSMQGMYYAGAIYEQGGKGVARDLKQAKNWYKRAASLGFIPAEAALNRLK